MFDGRASLLSMKILAADEELSISIMVVIPGKVAAL
jgi:hypothetical protein